LRAESLKELRELRANHPEALAAAARDRKRRPILDDSGRMMIIAADHPARASLAIGGRRLAMADRNELITRLMAALLRPGVDGILATPDVVEDLLLLGALEEKLVFGSMNRGGLRGASFELDDRFTAYDAVGIAASRLDGGKMLCHVDFEDRATVATLESCATAVNELSQRRTLAMIEPFVSHRVNGKLVNDLSSQAVITAAAIASALGRTSAYTWLKLPVCERPDEMEQVVAATTLPIVLLGGDPAGDRDAVFGIWESVLRLPGVLGLVVGRTLLYPADDDVEAAVDGAARLVRPELASKGS